jgi:hypothetical protein
MIAHHDLYGLEAESIEAALTAEPLATAATNTIAAFSVTSDLLAQVGDLAIEYGVGKPLAGFQALLATYRALIGTQAALALTAQSILSTAQQESTSH